MSNLFPSFKEQEVVAHLKTTSVGLEGLWKWGTIFIQNTFNAAVLKTNHDRKEGSEILPAQWVFFLGNWFL